MLDPVLTYASIQITNEFKEYLLDVHRLLYSDKQFILSASSMSTWGSWGKKLQLHRIMSLTCPNAQVSWCKLEVEISSPKNIKNVPNDSAPPPIIVAALSLKTAINATVKPSYA